MMYELQHLTYVIIPRWQPFLNTTSHAAVVRACKIQHLPLDRKTTCYCQYGPPPKKKLPKGKRMRTASFVAERKVASMRCQCTRNNTLGVHEQAVKDAIARKSLLSQTKKIAEETLRRYATEENRNKLSAIVTKQVAASQEVKQAMEQVQTKIQDSFQKMEAQAEIERAKEVLPDLDGLIEDDREYVCPPVTSCFLCLPHLTPRHRISLYSTY